MPDDPPEWLLQQRRAVGRRIRYLRLERGLSQEELAHTAGLDRKTINRAEVGSPHGIGLDVLLRIAHVLEVPPWQVMWGA